MKSYFEERIHKVMNNNIGEDVNEPYYIIPIYRSEILYDRPDTKKKTQVYTGENWECK